MEKNIHIQIQPKFQKKNPIRFKCSYITCILLQFVLYKSDYITNELKKKFLIYNYFSVLCIFYRADLFAVMSYKPFSVSDTDSIFCEILCIYITILI